MFARKTFLFSPEEPYLLSRTVYYLWSIGILFRLEFEIFDDKDLRLDLDAGMRKESGHPPKLMHLLNYYFKEISFSSVDARLRDSIWRILIPRKTKRNKRNETVFESPFSLSLHLKRGRLQQVMHDFGHNSAKWVKFSHSSATAKLKIRKTVKMSLKYISKDLNIATYQSF